MWERLLQSEELCPRREVIDWRQKSEPEHLGITQDMTQEKDRRNYEGNST